jgi:two-component system response regulator DevR
MISVAIIEDHQILVDTFGMMMRNDPEIQLVGNANTIAEGRELVHHCAPNVLLLDVGLPDGNGLDLIPEIKRCCPETQIVVLTSMTDETTLMRAIEGGVSGFVSKSSSLTDLLETIRQAASGEQMPTSLLMGLLMRMTRKDLPAKGLNT